MGTADGVDLKLLGAQADTVFFASEMFRKMGMTHISDLLLGAGEQLYHTWLHIMEYGHVTYAQGKRPGESTSMAGVHKLMQEVVSAWEDTGIQVNDEGVLIFKPVLDEELDEDEIWELVVLESGLFPPCDDEYDTVLVGLRDLWAENGVGYVLFIDGNYHEEDGGYCRTFRITRAEHGVSASGLDFEETLTDAKKV